MSDQAMGGEAMTEVELRGGAMDGQRVQRRPIEVGLHAGEIAFDFPAVITPEGDRIVSLRDVPEDVRNGFVAAMQKRVPPERIQGYDFFLARAFYRPQGNTEDGIPVYEFAGTEPEKAGDAYLTD